MAPLAASNSMTKKRSPTAFAVNRPDTHKHQGNNMNGTVPLKIKHHSLTGRITPELMYEAFRSVRKNRGAAGVDRQSVEMFEANLDQNLAALMKDLKRGTFQPRPALRKYIDKGGRENQTAGDSVCSGPRRTGSAAAVVDALVRTAVPRAVLRLPAGQVLP